MSLDPRTPVVVGAGAVSQHAEDPMECADALELMAMALERAAEDAGDASVLAAVDSIWIPRGFWAYEDPGGWLAERFGAGNVRRVVAEIGVLQTSVLGRAARDLSEGRSEVAVVVGGESRDRDTRLDRQGRTPGADLRAAGRPSEVLRPEAEIVGALELELGLAVPAIQYAMIENALRARDGQSLEAHRATLGALWADFSQVASTNPNAWDRTLRSAESIVTPDASNRWLAFPYTRSLVSQWNVNQAGALVLCTLEKARRLGLDASRFVYPLAVVDSEHMTTLGERRDLVASPGFELAGEAALAHVGVDIGSIDLLELYSCFPAAVRVQQRALGIDPRRRVTRTGGMTFAGGPLNNFVIQAWVEMVRTMREEGGRHGLVTAVSGFLTKQGVSVFGAEPDRPFLFDAVTDAVRERQATVEVVRELRGRARVVAYTVIHGRDGAASVALACDVDDRVRTLRVVPDAELAAWAMREELCGREVELGPNGALRWI